MGVRRPTRQSPIGVRPESRTGREIPAVAISPEKAPAPKCKRQPLTERLSRSTNIGGKSKGLEF